MKEMKREKQTSVITALNELTVFPIPYSSYVCINLTEASKCGK